MTGRSFTPTSEGPVQKCGEGIHAPAGYFCLWHTWH